MNARPGEFQLPESFAPERASTDAPWLEERRARAMEAFRAAGIPHRRVEEWKYSDLRSALESPRRGDSDCVSTRPYDPFAAIGAATLVVREGRCDAAAVVGEGIEAIALGASGETPPDWVARHFGQVLSSGMAQSSLALMKGGLAIKVRRGADARLCLRFQQGLGSVHERVLIDVEEGASLLLLESHGRHGGVLNLGVEIMLQPQARLTHIRLADGAPDAIQVEEIGLRVARGGRYEAHFATGGAKLSRLELEIALEGADAQAALSGVSVLDGDRHADVTTHIDHVAGATASRQLFKSVAGGKSRAVYQGKITVRKGADGSDSRQTAKAILLGERAEADLKPELEILADDVKCAHGAAIGDLDPDSLFYLRSRGIAESEARRLLLLGFLEEAVAEIASADIREAVWQFAEPALAGLLEGAP